MKYFVFSLLFFSVCSAQETIVELKNVSDTILNTKRVLSITGQPDAVKTMQKLFPGKLYKLSDRNIFVSWKCKTCKPVAYTDVNGEEGDQLFPYTNGVATRLNENIDYSDSKGNQFKLMIFNHSVYDEDGLQTSRFTGGLMGIAKFAKNGNSWEMKSFQPAIAAFGSFAQAPTPKLVNIGEDQYALTLVHSNGGAGGPYSGYLYLIAGFEGKYQPILEVPDYQLTNTQNLQWSGSYKVIADSNKKFFRDLLVTTTGTYKKPNKNDEEYDAEGPKEISEMMKTKKQFNFVIEQRFSFKGKKYNVVGKPVVKFSNIK
ncbi:MAG: hypothetical protein ABI441_15060 [Flavobacterium sp.]